MTKLSKEWGMKFNINRNCNVKDLNFHVKSNDFKAIKFRVNFYSIKNNLPAELLNKKDIIIELKNNFMGWFTADLDQYDIILNKEIDEVAVTIQWVESIKKDDKSKYFAISAATSPFNDAFFREKAMDSWTKTGASLSFYLNTMCE